MPTALLVTSLVNTIQVGSMYALMALGITLTFSVMKLPNFAHAELITVGAYTALVASLAVDAHPLLILLAAAGVGALVAGIGHRAVFKPLESQKLSLYTLILASFALGLIIRYALFTLADSFNLFNLRIGIPLQIVYRDGFLILTNVFALVLPTSVALVILLTLLLNRTALGREMRALANNAELARVIGIPVERVKSHAWLLVGALAGGGRRAMGHVHLAASADGLAGDFVGIRGVHPGRLVQFRRHDPRRVPGGFRRKHADALAEQQPGR